MAADLSFTGEQGQSIAPSVMGSNMPDLPAVGPETLPDMPAVAGPGDAGELKSYWFL